MPPDVKPNKGRGAPSNPTGRFEPTARADFDDGWGDFEDPDFSPPPLRTTVQPDKSRSVICRNDSPDIGFSQ